MKKAYKLLLLLFLIVMSCTKDKALPPSECTTVVSYSDDIRPIIENSCKTQAGPGTGCHDAWIDNYGTIKNFIDAGKWYNEIFVDKTMPEIPNDWGIDSLTQDELLTMKCWLDIGAPQN